MNALATPSNIAVLPNRHSALVNRLSEKSLTKRHDAYLDIAWDDPANRIDPEDPRWEKDADDPLGATEWYRGLPQPLRARIGLHHVACQMKIGVAFEAILGQGLLEFASALPNGSPEFRYAYHELIEEGQHSLMFQEFVNRAGMDARGLAPLDAWGARFVPRMGRTFPEVFFISVLGGEAPIDHVQRGVLARKRPLHPLLERVIRIHVTEEARHISFAKSLLADRVPRLSQLRHLQLQIRTPLILAASARSMLVPPRELVQAYAIPKSVLREAYYENAQHRASVVDSLEGVRALCHKIGLYTARTAPLWRALGVAPRAPETVSTPLQLRAPGSIGHLPGGWLRPVDRAA